MNNRIKVSIIGLDALSWEFLNKLMDKGCIPEIKNIVNKGFKYSLKCFPPSTPPSWSSILTGVNPGKHGIFAFDYVDSKTLEQKLYTAMDLQHPRIFEILSMMNMKSVVINPIPGYPIIPVRNSIIISHTILLSRPQYFPKTVKKYADILAEVASEKLTLTCYDTLEYYLEYVLAIKDIVEKLLFEKSWNLFLIILPVPDIILHKCEYNFLRETLSLETKLFNKIDKLAKILSQISDITVLVSDHGFTYYNRLIRINDILAKEGIVTTVNKHCAKGALKEYKEVKAEFSGKHVDVNETFVDKFRSKAFYISKWNLGVYVKSLEETFRILKILNNVEGLSWAKPRESVFWGPYVNKAPHIVIRPEFEKGYLQGDNKVKGVVYEDGVFKDHSPNGVLIIKTDNVKLQENLKIPNYIVAPLILSLMNIPLSKHSDGVNILYKLFAEEEPKIVFKNYSAKWKILKRIAKTQGSTSHE